MSPTPTRTCRHLAPCPGAIGAQVPVPRRTCRHFFLVGGVISLAVLLASGTVDADLAVPVAVLLPASVLGFLASGPLLRRLDPGPVRPVVLTLATLAPLAVLAREVL